MPLISTCRWSHLLLLRSLLATREAFRGEFCRMHLGTIFTRCFFIQLFETGFYAMALWSLGARGVPWLDVLSYTGYKYVALCVK